MSARSEEKNAYYYSAMIVSYMFHPIFIPSYLFITFYYYGKFVFHPLKDLTQFYVVLLLIVTTAIIPLIMLFFYMILNKRKMSSSDIFMDNSRERFVPFLYTGIFYSALTYILFTELHFPLIIIYYLSIISISVLAVACISLFWKISAHAISMGAALIMFALTYTVLPDEDFFNVILVTFFISGLVLSSRLYLNAHKPSQVYIGYLLGIIIGACGLYELIPNILHISFPF
ncbi:MAG: phosphatase PAP2 family protein [Cytophagales bacterium]|nr:phosphatase PAP2 family protein [Cytophaga sp.]